MNYIDTHCHLNFSQFHQDLEKVINESYNAGLIKLVNVGTDLKDSKESINLASRYKDIFASVGIHPHNAKIFNSDTLVQLELMAKDHKVIAIGEIGLDYFRNLSAKERQKEVFTKQLNLAIKLEKPIIIHCRDAYKDVIDLLDKEYLPYLKDRLPGVIHSFSAGPNYLREFLKRGFYIGFNGMVTYSGNDKLLESLKLTPKDKILIETDAPFLPPQNYRGNRNEPKLIIEVAKVIAQNKECNLNEVAEFTTANAFNLFNLK